MFDLLSSPSTSDTKGPFSREEIQKMFLFSPLYKSILMVMCCVGVVNMFLDLLPQFFFYLFWTSRSPACGFDHYLL
uniref:Uncharacterized protein n=1 Tax=Arundo donax TaxID=35708 RepID=A0A0A9CCP3_ARUDO